MTHPMTRPDALPEVHGPHLWVEIRRDLNDVTFVSAITLDEHRRKQHMQEYIPAAALAAERARAVALIDQQRQKLVRDITDIYGKDMSDDSRRTMGEWVRCESLLTRLRNAINEPNTTAAEGGSSEGTNG